MVMKEVAGEMEESDWGMQIAMAGGRGEYTKIIPPTPTHPS